MNTINIRKQKGIVLFVALIALLVMSLASVALIRSVDTNTLISGNLSYKQAAISSADQGIEAGLIILRDLAASNPDGLLLDDPSNGYFATFTDPSPDLDDRTVLKDKATWESNSKTINVVGSESVSIIIQRMCREAIEPTKEECLFGEEEVGTGSQGTKSISEAGAKINGAPSPMYRITVRSEGAKNTVTYTQTYVY